MASRILRIAALLTLAGLSAARADGPSEKSAPPPATVQSRAVFGVSVTVLDDRAPPPPQQQAPGK